MSVDAIVVGSGPNGMAAAVTLARAGLSVRVYEQAPTIGGGSRTLERTLPGFLHDVGSAVHPLAFASGFFRAFELAKRVPFVTPELSYGHPLDGGRAALAWRDLDRTASELGADGPAWRALFAPLVDRVGEVAEFAGSAILRMPRHPATAIRLGLRVLEQGTPAWNLRFREELAPALLTGTAAHTIRPFPGLSTAAVALVLATHAHAGGWPIPIGGSQSIINALADDLLAHGGEIVTDTYIDSLAGLPAARAVIVASSARHLLAIGGERLPERYRRALARVRYGNAAAKVDFALSEPVPWANDALRSAGTLHVGGTREEIAAGERDVARGRHPASPYVLVSQPTRIDPSRAPAGKHVLWAYTHVPAGSTEDPVERVTAQLERFAPGFRDTILAAVGQSAVQIESFNPAYIGGDIASGDVSLAQIIARPVASADPWRTPLAGLYLGSASATPGPGVHGLSGYYAARSALKHEFGLRPPALGMAR